MTRCGGIPGRWSLEPAWAGTPGTRRRLSTASWEPETMRHGETRAKSINEVRAHRSAWDWGLGKQFRAGAIDRRAAPVGYTTSRKCLNRRSLLNTAKEPSYLPCEGEGHLRRSLQLPLSVLAGFLRCSRCKFRAREQARKGQNQMPLKGKSLLSSGF